MVLLGYLVDIPMEPELGLLYTEQIRLVSWL